MVRHSLKGRQEAIHKDTNTKHTTHSNQAQAPEHTNHQTIQSQSTKTRKMDPKGTHLPPTPTATVAAATSRTKPLPQQKPPTIITAILHGTNNTISGTQCLHTLTQTEKELRPPTDHTQNKSATTQSHVGLATATRATTHSTPAPSREPTLSATRGNHHH